MSFLVIVCLEQVETVSSKRSASLEGSAQSRVAQQRPRSPFCFRLFPGFSLEFVNPTKKWLQDVFLLNKSRADVPILY